MIGVIFITLKNKLFGLTAYSFIDTVLLRFFGVISFIIIVRLLDRSDIGIIGVATGYLVFFNFLALAPETILLRDYPKVKDRINQYISSFMIFWFIRSFIMIVLAGIIAFFLYHQFENRIVPIYFIGATVLFNMGMFQSLITELFYVSFRQKIVMTMHIVLSLFATGLVFLLFFKPTLMFYLFLSFISTFVGLVTWYYLLKRYFAFKFIYAKDSLKIVKNSIKDFALWQHFNGTITYLIYRIDTVILSFFVTLTIIGDYTIALGIANFFFLVPQIVQKTAMVGLSNINTKTEEGLFMSIVLKYSFILGIAQLLLFILFGKWIIQTLFTSEHVEQIFLYTVLITCGVTILNFMRPVMSLIASKCSLKEGFFQVYLPAGIMALVGYIILTYFYGPVGTAIGNIVGYSVFALLQYSFINKKYPLHFKFELITAEEKEMFKNLLSRL